MEKDPKKLELPRTERDEDKFYSREECIRFCQMMLMNKMFFRGLKVYKEDTKKLEEKKEEVSEQENKKSDNGEEENDDDKKVKKRKYKIDMNRIQGFYDSSDEIFIWMFHPTPFMHWVYGSLVLLLVIGGTLFPLWPSSLRTTVYYGSVSCASFIARVLKLIKNFSTRSFFILFFYWRSFGCRIFENDSFWHNMGCYWRQAPPMDFTESR